MTTTAYDFIKQKIICYLTEDNPIPENFYMKCSGFFSGRGETGRIRAHHYLNLIEGYSRYDNEIFVIKVYQDFNLESSHLKGSTTLRRRIGEGLCQCFGVLAKVDRSVDWRYRQQAKFAPYGAPLPDKNIIRDLEIERVLKNQMENSIGCQLLQDNDFILSEMKR